MLTFSKSILKSMSMLVRVNTNVDVIVNKNVIIHVITNVEVFFNTNVNVFVNVNVNVNVNVVFRESTVVFGVTYHCIWDKYNGI